MALYTLIVSHGPEALPTETVTCRTASEVVELIPSLLVRHPACHRIHVRLGALHLFSVDCHGKTVAE